MKVIATTALLDGSGVQQGIETVAAQVAALQTLLADPMLANLSFQPITVTQDKTTRSLPLVSRCEQGKLAIVRGGWNKEFLDELAGFPESAHDDMVDAAVAAAGHDSSMLRSTRGSGSSAFQSR